MYSIITFDVHGDERGALIALEGETQIPFDIKRVFYVYETQKDSARGCHANRKSQFVLISVNGECKVTIKMQSGDIDVVLDSPNKGLFLDRMVWKEMHSFSVDSVLLVLCSENYNQEEYIYNFEEYIAECKNVKPL